MGLKVVEKENNVNAIQAMEEGVYPARIVQVVDLGLQQIEYNKELKEAPRVIYTFEFPDEFVVIDGEELPRRLSKEYTFPNTEYGWKQANLRELISAAGKVDVLTKHLNKPVMVTVGTYESKKGGTRNKVVSVSGVPKGLKVGNLVNPQIAFEMGDPIPEELPDWIKNKIRDSFDFKWMNNLTKEERNNNNER